MSGKYDQYVFTPPHLKLSMKKDGTVFFDGLMCGHQLLGVDFTFGQSSGPGSGAKVGIGVAVTF